MKGSVKNKMKKMINLNERQTSTNGGQRSNNQQSCHVVIQRVTNSSRFDSDELGGPILVEARPIDNSHFGGNQCFALQVVYH